MHASRMRRYISLFGLTLTALALPATATAADRDLDRVRAATEAFKDVDAATAAGYAVLAGTPLEACIDEPGKGAMGFHRVNGDLVGDTVLDPTKPEALLYVPDSNGRLELLGVEYVVFAEAWDKRSAAPPTVLGQELHLVEAPNRYELPAFYELHAWVWKRNPSGTFFEWNPSVRCAMPDTATRAGAASAPSHPVPLAFVAGAALLALVAAARFGVRRRQSA